MCLPITNSLIKVENMKIIVTSYRRIDDENIGFVQKKKKKSVYSSHLSKKESSIPNLVTRVFHVVFFGFIILAGFYNGRGRNLIMPRGLTPFGTSGILDEAATVYFSCIRYDSVSTMTEEIKNPSKSFPFGIAGSVLIVSLLYYLMALVLCVMIPYNEISDQAEYAVAFQRNSEIVELQMKRTISGNDLPSGLDYFYWEIFHRVWITFIGRARTSLDGFGIASNYMLFAGTQDIRTLAWRFNVA